MVRRARSGIADWLTQSNQYAKPVKVIKSHNSTIYGDFLTSDNGISRVKTQDLLSKNFLSRVLLNEWLSLFVALLKIETTSLTINHSASVFFLWPWISRVHGSCQGDSQRCQGRVVGQEHQRFARPEVFETNTSQLLG